MDLEGIRLSEREMVRERQILYDLIYTWNNNNKKQQPKTIKQKTNEQTKQDRNSLTGTENKLVGDRG